jgi:hypothetical protein
MFRPLCGHLQGDFILIKIKIIIIFICYGVTATQLTTFFFLNNQTDALIIQIYSVIKLLKFWASSLPIIRSSLLYIRHWEVSCSFLMIVSKQNQDGTAVPY